MSNCATCSWEQLNGEVVDNSLSNRAWAKKLGVDEKSLRRHRKHSEHQAAPTSGGVRTPAKILEFDLETSPNLAYVWGLWDQNVGLNQLEAATEVMCFGARWVGTDEVIFRSVFHDGKEKMLSNLWTLFDEADAIMGWNSKGFDSKHVNREFLVAEMPPPSPWKEMDLMQAVKSKFRFPSNKLDYVAGALGVGQKVKHMGFELWKLCMANDPEAWEQMRVYQIQDVNLLDDLYYKLLPWLPASMQPNMALATHKPHACPSCGSENIRPNGYKNTGASSFPAFVCNDCNTHLHSGKRVESNELRIS